MDERKYIELIRKAQRGDKKALNSLAELAAERLRVYVYRLTLADDLTQEIVQETMLEMCRILGKLKDADKFWPWLYGIATNKIHRHHRTERTQKNLAKSKVAHATLAADGPTPGQREHGLQNLVTQELKQVVAAAMQSLKTRHRAVLVMRCYDQMSYAEIAESMGCSEFGTRMLFLRAKRALRKQLSRNGFGRGSLLAALVLFGKMTAPTEAAAAQVSVTAATTGVGLLAGLVGLAATKTAIISLSTAGLIAGAVAVTSGLPDASIQTAGQNSPNAQSFAPLGQKQNGNEEYWYYFPEGPARPMMMRVKAGPESARPHAQFLQNDQANYYFDDNVIYINNHRMYDAHLSVLRLPTDTPQLSSFLDRIEGGGGTQKMQYVPNSAKGLLVIAARSAEQGPNRSWVTRHYNVLDEDYFQGDWPAGLETIDKRDPMHKRGWTYFKIAGRVNEQAISGAGRIPFVYAAGARYSPWLKLNAGDLTIVDTTAGSYVSGADSAARTHYKAGAFFNGLPRPWMGLHAIDTVRRDAAERQIPFKTEQIDDNKVRVRVTDREVTLLYTIDLQVDVIDQIAVSTGDVEKGVLKFSYLQDIDDVGNEFVSPRTAGYQTPPQQAPGPGGDAGLLWLVQLAEGSLAK
jgi:RNA polymerase sigma-70 factor (ECF subfamily)